MARIDRRATRRLDVLVNDIWGGEKLTGRQHGTRRSGSTISTNGLRMLRLAIETHLITSAPSRCRC